MLSKSASERILATSRSNETFQQRTNRSVQNYYIRQAFACFANSGPGQYTKAVTMPYHQRHADTGSRTSSPARGERDPSSRPNHTWGSERSQEGMSFFKKSPYGTGSDPSSSGHGLGEGEREYSLDHQQRQYHSRDGQGGLQVHTEWPTPTYNDAAAAENDGFYFYQQQDTVPKYGNTGGGGGGVGGGGGSSGSRPTSAHNGSMRSPASMSSDPQGMSPVSHTSSRAHPQSPRQHGGSGGGGRGGPSSQRQRQPLSPHEQRLRHLLKLISSDMKL
jgi:hypothetical protein